MAMTNTQGKMSLNKLGSTNFVRLFTLACLINYKKSYGKEINDYIKTFNKAWTPSLGRTYTILISMYNEGLVTRYKDENDPNYNVKGRERFVKVYYEITDLGMEYYKMKHEEFKVLLVSATSFYNRILSQLPEFKYD